MVRMSRPLFSTPFVSSSVIHCSLFLLGVLSTVPWGFFPSWRLPLLYIAVYFWTLFQPNLLKLSLLSGIGIICDAIMGLPIGLTVGEIWLIWWLTLGQRRLLLGKGFHWVWGGFVSISALVFGLRLLFLMLSNHTVPQMSYVLYDLLVMWIIFPLMASALGRINHWVRGR